MPFTINRISPEEPAKDAQRWLLKLVRHHGTGLRRYLSTYSAHPEDIDDWTQEAFLRVFAALRSRSIDNPAAYLFRTARNVALSRFAHRQVRDLAQPQLQAMHILAMKDDPVRHSAQQSQQHEALLAAIGSMPDRPRQVFVMCRMQGQSHREVAEKLGIAVSTVEKHLSKGLRHCRQVLLEQAVEDTAAGKQNVLRRAAGE